MVYQSALHYKVLIAMATSCLVHNTVRAAGVCKCPCTTASGHAHHLPPGKRSDIEGWHSCSSSDPLQSRHHGPATRHKTSPPGALPPWAQYGTTCISWLTVKGNPDTIPLASTGIPCPGKQRILPAQCDTRVNVAIPVTTFILHSSWCHSQWPSHHKWLMVNASGTAAHTIQPAMAMVLFLPHFSPSLPSPSLSTPQ